jgi:acetolactate synthase-1/2/3 large subunit
MTELDAQATTTDKPADTEPATTIEPATFPGEGATALEPEASEPDVPGMAEATEAEIAEPAEAPTRIAGTETAELETTEADTAEIETTEVDTADVEPSPDAASDAPQPLEGPRSVGRFIADALRSAGVRYAFTVPGESFLGLLDAFEGAGIKVIATRHEGAAAFMAEAHGQLTGRPAVCLGTRAVGGSNLAIGIHTARQNSTPLFAAIGQVERAFLGREAFQEIDQVATLGGLAKWAAEPHDIAEVASITSEAIRQALGGRPGPVLLSLPEDLLDESMPEDARLDAGRPSLPRASDEEIRAVIEMLASARRPVILAGAGILRARTSTELLRFAELLQVPIIASWRRADVISNDHPLYLGMAGLGAPATVRDRLESADALVVFGSRLNEATSYGYTIPRAGMRWAHVDVMPIRPAGLPEAELAVASDAKAFLRAANERLVGRAVLDAERVATRQASNAADRAAWEAASIVDDVPWDGPGVHPGRTVTTLRRVLPDDAILTTDAGNFAGWAARGYRFRRPGTFLGTTSGAMGYGLPAAIAASLVHRDRAVVALVGDGGLGMTLAELETAVRVGARVVVVVFDNERYGTIRMWQEQRGTGIGVATELGPLDFAAVARACGARGVRVEKDAEFEAALRGALAADRTTLLHLSLDRRWVSVDQPPT